ncbi:Helix-turn-helix domain protein [Tepidanaerobacter acetatoxydans Re1]|jgi:transcriptional regulator with XRE-family HTH domain|uniref:Helix-turn-helix domain protein n=1 Tax=Tepidanaerobacter acetatoxydans (strain DSM 21804 / JCM 16047 / Re1) TaxID=1209989 RepID=F4LTV5_TEPAE|nr:helix-turn-helix transcriptional regulator [Tepidanaerobacter acetatoxydans]AEE92552.1 helix-turn-helix domain protein [Tepidanaerobacter acetatoxydans Re1]CDI41041.1 Helix-turn-helix domain protein [Tepidanaerobacter acetatoxydans Re1]
MNKFGEFITARRKAEKITLRKMAELLDFSPAYWSDIEKGRRNPPNINKLEELARILKLTSEEKYHMIDLASEDRDEIPMDLPDYIKDSGLARTALRKARRMDEKEGSSDITERAWKEFIKTLDEERGK